MSFFGYRKAFDSTYRNQENMQGYGDQICVITTILWGFAFRTNVLKSRLKSRIEIITLQKWLRVT